MPQPKAAVPAQALVLVEAAVLVEVAVTGGRRRKTCPAFFLRCIIGAPKP